MDDISARITRIIVDHLGVDAAKITRNMSFIDDLGVDSLDTVELVMAFEEEFGCEIPDAAAGTIVTVKDAVTFITAYGRDPALELPHPRAIPIVVSAMGDPPGRGDPL